MAKGVDITLPSHLSEYAKQTYADIFRERNLAGRTAQQHQLLQGIELLDRAEAARRQVAADGPVIKDRFQQEKEHPAIRTERQCRMAFAQILNKLPWGRS